MIDDMEKTLASLDMLKFEIEKDIEDDKKGVAAVCCWDGLNDRISYLKECRKDFSNSEYAFICHEEISSLIKVLSEMCEDGDFDINNEIAAGEYIGRLKNIFGLAE